MIVMVYIRLTELNKSDIRTFCHVDDAATVVSYFVDNGYTGVFNVGSDIPENTVTIKQLADFVIEEVGHGSTITDDESQGIGFRRPNVTKLKSLGLQCNTPLHDIISSNVKYWRSRIEL